MLSMVAIEKLGDSRVCRYGGTAVFVCACVYVWKGGRGGGGGGGGGYSCLSSQRRRGDFTAA